MLFKSLFRNRQTAATATASASACACAGASLVAVLVLPPLLLVSNHHAYVIAINVSTLQKRGKQYHMDGARLRRHHDAPGKDKFCAEFSEVLKLLSACCGVRCLARARTVFHRGKQ